MCALWQRFGRGARDPTSEAIALCLVEPKHFDASKDKAAARKEKAAQRVREKLKSVPQKRKASKALPAESRYRNHSQQHTAQTPEVNEDERAGQDEDVVMDPSNTEVRTDTRQILYTTVESKGRKQTTRSVGLEAVLEDVVNAKTRGINCYRAPPNIYFSNNATGE